jgi:DNA-binding response OmpR family regulator
VNDLDALRGLSEIYGVPGIDLSEVVIRLEDLALIPREVCETHGILPLMVRGEHIFLAMENPKDTKVVDEIEFVTGRKVYPYAALPEELAKTTALAHEAAARKAVYYYGPNVPPERLRELGIDKTGKPTREGQRVEWNTTSPSGMMASVVAPIVTPLIPPPMDEVKEATASSTNVSEGDKTPVPPPMSERGSGGRATSEHGHLILVVDDEEEIRTMLRRVLLAKGHRVIEASTGPVALRMVKEHIPDLLVLDAMLPGLHGFDVARRLKGSERYGKIPIIMISAVYRGWRVAEDLKASYGIFEYFEKPFRLNAVLDGATRALAQAKEEDPGETTDLDVLSADAAKALDDGIAAYRAGDVDHAITLLERGTKLDPLAYRLHFHLALLYGKKDRVFDSIGSLEIAIGLHPKHFQALRNLAILYERAGFKNRAVEMWERALASAPDAVSRSQVKERLLLLL